jgi:BioD-like phosphotransacetylase family protein
VNPYAVLPFVRVANTILQAAIGRVGLRGRMRRLLIVSTEEHSGKSLLSLGLGRALQARGVSVAYMKPISYEVSYATGEPIDRDAAAIRSLLSLEDDVHDIAPIPLEGPFLREAIEAGDRGFRQRIAEAFDRISAGRGAVLVEGRGFLGMGMSAGLSDLDLADLLGCDVLLLTRYDGEEAIDRILCALRLFEQGPSVLGVILKDVPLDRSYSLIGEVISSFLADRGAEVLGIIPHDPNLRCVSTDEIARRLGGRTLTHFEDAREVRHFVVGVSGIEPSLRSFRRTPEFAVITGGDQTDLQLAALDVPELRCLVLTGDQRPSRQVIDRADKNSVPVILAGQNTLATANLCSSMLDRFWVLPGPSLEYAVDHVRSNIDVERILEKARDG